MEFPEKSNGSKVLVAPEIMHALKEESQGFQARLKSRRSPIMASNGAAARADTWCLLLARTLTSSVGMLYRLPSTGACVCQFGGAMVVVVWQWEVNLPDCDCTETLHLEG